MLSEISQSPEDKYCMVSLPEGPRGEKFRETTRMVVARDWGRGGTLFHGCDFSFAG